MFNKSVDDRLSIWAQHRAQLNISADPLTEVWEFWRHVPFIPFNNKINPHHSATWPTPWDIIVENKYDDFTKSLMIGHTLLLTHQYKNSTIEIKIFLDKDKARQYNVVCVDNTWAINYTDNGPILIADLPESLFLENIISVAVPR